MWLFWDREKVSLRDVVLQPKVSVVKDPRIIKGISLGEKVSNKISVFSLLRRVSQVGNHKCTLNNILSHFSCELVLVYESEFCARGVQQNLMNHVISSSAILYHAIESYIEIKLESEHRTGNLTHLLIAKRIIIKGNMIG